jgi:N-acyl homoserine lactone hydrolase
VQLPETGAIVLPFDAADLRENWDQEVLPGECYDDEAALRAIQRLKALEKEINALTLLLHDPVAVQSMKLAPDAYC